MPKLEMLKIDGTKATSLELPALFTATPKKALLHQAVVTYLANQRQSNAHTKTRGEVRGGGRKPWKQKGTGRARAGSSRSPIWIGGGITFGPRNVVNYSKQFPAKMKRLALAMALSDKVANDQLVIVDILTLTQPKTKEIAGILATLAPTAKSVLIITATVDPVLLQAANNLTGVTVVTVQNLNTYTVLSHQSLIMTEEAVKAAQQHFGVTVTEEAV